MLRLEPRPRWLVLPWILLLAACGPGDEDDPTLCSDRADNDKDGLVDCQEPSCAAYCPTSPTAPAPQPTAQPTPSPQPTTPTTTTVDTDDTGDGSDTVHLMGTVRLQSGLNPQDFEVELLGSGMPATVTDRYGRWALEIPPGTYPWRVTAPDGLSVPSTGTELTVAFPIDTATSPSTDPDVDQVFDVLLPNFPADIPLPLFGSQITQGLELTLDSLVPVGGDEEAETVQAAIAPTPLPIEGVQQVHLMYFLAPEGHTGSLDVSLVYRYDPDLELWALDPATGRWRSFGGFVDAGNDRIDATQVVPWMTTLALVTP